MCKPNPILFFFPGSLFCPLRHWGSKGVIPRFEIFWTSYPVAKGINKPVWRLYAMVGAKIHAIQNYAVITSFKLLAGRFKRYISYYIL